MQRQVSSIQPNRNSFRSPPNSAVRLALDENELAARWGLSVKTLRRWRQEKLGPINLKLGSRVTYLIHHIEVYERRVSRHSTSSVVYQ